MTYTGLTGRELVDFHTLHEMLFRITETYFSMIGLNSEMLSTQNRNINSLLCSFVNYNLARYQYNLTNVELDFVKRTDNTTRE